MTSRLAIVFLLAASACSPRLLPGTEIEETRDTRAIYDTVLAYRQAMEKRDAAAVLALVSPDYLDQSGTGTPEDDVDRGELERRLAEDLATVDPLKLNFTIRRIDVTGNQAAAEIFYDSWYRVKTPGGGVVPRRDSDVHRMQLKRADKAWLFTSGL
jgi:hypothetical protein